MSEETSARSAPEGGASLLLVGPDAAATAALASRLRGEGFARRLAQVPTLRAALAELATGPWDLVLLALAAPDAAGVDGIDRIRAIDPEVPVVVWADGEDEGLAMAAIQRGAQDCVVKEDLDGRGAARILRHAMERQRIMLELHEAREREQYLATHDPLTGLPNRTLFYDRLTQAIAAASRYEKILAVLFLDLDGFKPVNDTLGHTAGDRLLQVAAQRMAGLVRRSDTVARIGGDEFTLLLAQVAAPADAAKVAENVLSRLAEPVDLGGAERCVTASIGIATYPADGELADTLVRNADAAMYRAKRAGGGRYAFFDRTMRHAP